MYNQTLIVRLGDKIYINIEPKDISYIDENDNNISLWEYTQVVVPINTTS